MREIKFRAWDKKSKKIREVINIIYTNISFDYMDYKTFNEIKLVYLKGRDMIYDKYIQISRKKIECELMQYTGLKDKNGVEIYEGDIILANGKKHKVWFSGDAFGLIETNGNFYEYICNLSHLSGRAFEVVGNIYENPGLLKDNK